MRSTSQFGCEFFISISAFRSILMQLCRIERALPHPVMDPLLTPVCLLTKDPQRQYKDLLAEKKVGFVDRVVGVTKLKGKVKIFQSILQFLYLLLTTFLSWDASLNLTKPGAS
jgi:hypothetical protein